MTKHLAVLTAGAAVFAVGVFSTASIAKPMNAAEVETPKDREGFGCIVRASELDPYQFDADCRSQLVVKRDKDGNLVSVRYHDNGELQPGQVAPDRAVRIDVTDILGGLPCTGREVISASGRYSSNLHCK